MRQLSSHDSWLFHCLTHGESNGIEARSDVSARRGLLRNINVGAEEGRFAQAASFSVATKQARNLRDLRYRRPGQPVFVTSDHPLARKGQIAHWEKFNVRLAVVRFSDNVLLGYDPADLLLPTRFDEAGLPVFELRDCELCRLPFSLTQQELEEEAPSARCPACQDF